MHHQTCSNLSVLLALVSIAVAQEPPVAEAQRPAYERKAPRAAPATFAPGVISLPDAYEYGSVLSADGRELFFGVDLGERAEIRFSRWEEGAWTAPEVLLGEPGMTYGDPFLSADGNRLYFISDRPGAMRGAEREDYDIWYVDRSSGAWSDPITLGAPVNSTSDEYYISIASSGRIYFASNRNAPERRGNFDVFAADPSGDGFAEPAPLPGELNTESYEADAFVAPDESYLIFCSKRADGLGEGDLYLSRQKADGTWSAGRHLGAGINTPGHELCPFVTADGSYFLFTSNKQIAWVHTSALAP